VIVLDTQLLRGAFVTGTVTSALGQPLRNVRRQLRHRDDTSDASWITSPWQTEMPQSTLTGDELWQPLELDDGEYAIEHLVPGRSYALYVSAEGHGTTIVGPWTGTLEGSRQNVVLRDPHTLEVQVLLPDGLPASHASVNLFLGGTVAPLQFPGSRYTDPEGRLVHDDALAGPYEVSVTRGKLHGREHFELPARGGTTRIVVRLEETN